MKLDSTDVRAVVCGAGIAIVSIGMYYAGRFHGSKMAYQDVANTFQTLVKSCKAAVSENK